MKRVLAAILATFFLFTLNVNAEEAQKTKLGKFSVFDQTSEETINQDYWNTIVTNMVFSRDLIIQLSTEQRPRTGSRISSTRRMPKGADINYVPYDLIKDSYDMFITAIYAYISESGRVDVRSYNRDEQLAYWLNLRNAMVLAVMFDNYPVAPKEMEQLIAGVSEDTLNWDSQMARVDRTMLSIREVEAIILNNWDDPLVIYGLFNGTRRGPFLMNEAFYGDSVYAQLRRNAREYLGASKTIEASRKKGITLPAVYGWYADLFDNETDALLSHISAHASGSTAGKIKKYASLGISYTEDWTTNDLPSHLKLDEREELFLYGQALGCFASVNVSGAYAGATCGGSLDATAAAAWQATKTGAISPPGK